MRRSLERKRIGDMETLGIVLAILVGYIWVGGFVGERFPKKSWCHGEPLVERYGRFPSCPVCSESDLWSKERKFVYVAFWPVTIPVIYVFKAGRNIGRKGKK